MLQINSYLLLSAVILVGCASQPTVPPLNTGEDNQATPDSLMVSLPERLCRKDLYSRIRPRSWFDGNEEYQNFLKKSAELTETYSKQYLGNVFDKSSKAVHFVFDEAIAVEAKQLTMPAAFGIYETHISTACYSAKERQVANEKTTFFLMQQQADVLEAFRGVLYSPAFDGYIFLVDPNQKAHEELKSEILREFGDSVMVDADDRLPAVLLSQ